MYLFACKVVGWSIGDSLATGLASEVLRQAIESRRPNGRRLLHHSDRGCQYTSDSYQKTLATLGINCSMSQTECCYGTSGVGETMKWFLESVKNE